MEGEAPVVDVVYQRLLQLVGRAFYVRDYRELSTQSQPEAEAEATPSQRKTPGKKKDKDDCSGLGVVVLDSLLLRPWWEEEDLARRLHLNSRAVRQVLRLLETHSLVAREHRKEKRKRKDAAAQEEVAVQGDVVEENDQEKGNLISYCSVDYQRVYDITRLRIHKMRRKLKEDLEDRKAVQEYACTGCGRTYTTLQAPFLIKPDGMFHCEDCDTVLEPVADGQSGQADTMTRKQRSQAIKAKQAQLEEELKPLTETLGEIEKRIAKGASVPDFGTLAGWAANEAAKLNQQNGTSRGKANGQAQIKVDLSGLQEVQASTSEAGPRELPPWLQQQTAVGASGPLASTSYSVSQDGSDVKDVKSASPDEQKKLSQASYMQQYQERLEKATLESRMVGKRPKAEGGWEEVQPEGGGWAEAGVVPGTAGVTSKPPIKQERAIHGVDFTLEAEKIATDVQGATDVTPSAAEEDEEDWEDV